MAVPNIGMGGGGFQISPGVNVTEIDLTTVVPSVATTDGAIAGVFRWGPVDQILLIDSENALAARYGKPSSLNAETWFSAANFLAYGNRLYVSRAANTFSTLSAVANSSTLASTAENFDANTAVSNTNDTIAFADANTVFSIGERVQYKVSAGNTAIGGLVPNNYYYIREANTSTIKLSLTPQGDSLNLTAGVNETGHSLEIAIADIYTNHTIKNENDYISKQSSFNSKIQYIAKYPGALGDSLKISVCDTANQYSSTVNLRNTNSEVGNASFNSANTKININVGDTSAVITLANSAALADDTPLPYANTVSNYFSIGDVLEVGNNSIGKQYLKIIDKTITVVNTSQTNTGSALITLKLDQTYKLSANYESNTVNRYWEYFNQVDGAPGQSDYVAQFGNTSAQDLMHAVIVDAGGLFSGAPGTVLEVYGNVSRATDAKNSDGSTNYYKTVINNTSGYVWSASDRPGAPSATAALIANASSPAPMTIRFNGGADGSDESQISFGDLARAYDVYQSAEAVDISLVLTGKARGGLTGEQLANYLIDNIAESRKDCVVFASPDKADVVDNTGGATATDIINFRNNVRSSSYAVMDSGYKYQYDKYNDVYRWVPLNGDIAGLAVRTDSIADPWFSPAGFARGQIKNVVKLAFNPSKSERDVLYKAGVNPVVTFPGQGTILYGDKTLLNKPSAFDRINVRRLFITLEKAIANAAKFTLFEFNDEFTRAQFKSLIEPFLRDVQGRRGIYDYRVVCDETNNTTEVVDSNRFVGDIYVKPAKSINYIQLNFVAVRSGVEFTEVAGV